MKNNIVGRCGSGLALAATLLVFGMAPAANASVVYDFAGNGGNLGTSEVFITDGVQVTVTGKRSNGNVASIHQTNSGLGVIGDGSGWVDPAEQLSFDWSPLEVVMLGGIAIERQSQSGKLQVYVDGDFLESFSWSGNAYQGIVNLSFASSFADRTGSVFTFEGKTDTFRIAQVTVVPEPSLGILVALGVAGIFLGNRRRRTLPVA